MAKRKPETVEVRALKIASVIMTEAGLCRYETPNRCQRWMASEDACEKCIRVWLLNRARRELRQEEEAEE